MNKNYKILFLTLVIFFTFINFSTPTYAQSTVGTPTQSPAVGTPTQSPPATSVGTTGCGTGVTLCNPLKSINSLPDLLNAVLGAIVTLGTIFLTLALIYVGFLFVAARGNEEKIRSARSALVWTVIGGLILLGAKAIGVVIQFTVNGL